MKRSKHELFVFPPKKILIKRRHCSIGQSSCSMTSKGSIDWLLESSRAWSFFTRVFANQPKPTPVCIRSINRSNRCIPVRLFFLFCSRVFISRSYKNRSITFKLFHYHDEKVNFIIPQSALKNSTVRSTFEFRSAVGWPFGSMDEILKWDHSNERYRLVISCEAFLC